MDKFKKRILAFLAQLKSYLTAIKNKTSSQGEQTTRVKKVNFEENIKEFYEQGRGWQYDNFDSVCQSRARYKKAFFVAMGLAIFLVFTIMMMMPLKQLVPVVIQQDKNGLIWVSTADFKTKFTHSKEQVKSELYP